MIKDLTIYGIAYNWGTILYKDKDCTELYCIDPWHRHRTNKKAMYDGFKWNLVMVKSVSKKSVRKVMCSFFYYSEKYKSYQKLEEKMFAHTDYNHIVESANKYFAAKYPNFDMTSIEYNEIK